MRYFQIALNYRMTKLSFIITHQMRITGLCEINETSVMFSPLLYCNVLLLCYHITKMYQGINYSTLLVKLTK